jgi:hypoxanthine phosphoribosyltransferase
MGRRILIVDDVWANGRNMVVVKSRAIAAGAQAETAVLHYRPRSNLFPSTGPDYYGAITDRFIVYPWETPQMANNATDTRATLPTN